ncbi:reverse transcriptase domain-containing protein [Tanacetum coccineum]
MIEEESPEGKGEVATTEEVLVNPSFPDQQVTIGGGLSEACRDQLKCLLKDNMGVFTWEPSDMTGMPLRVIKHMLNVNPSLIPVMPKSGEHFAMEKKAGLVTTRSSMGQVETFDNLHKINMKLNPKKCSFGVEEGKFLGYMVTSKGIRANPKKTKDLADLKSPRTLKEMQNLSGKLAALNRFLAKTLNEAEQNYAPMEKLALSLIHMTKRLRRYFEAHPVKVITVGKYKSKGQSTAKQKVKVLLS